MKIFPLTCGWLSIPGDYLLPGHSPAEKMICSVGMFVIEHSRGLVLFDTGSAPETAENLADYWGEQLAADYPYHVDRREIIDGQLFDLGYHPEEVRYVVMSHLHMDHAGGLRFFNNAEIFVQKDELADAVWPPPGFNDGSYNPADFLPTRNNNSTMHKLTGDCDLFGDRSLVVLRTPGHTVGHSSLLIDLPHTGRVLLPGDACLCRQAFELATLPGDPVVDPEAARSSCDRIACYINNGALPLFSHIPHEDYHSIDNCYD